MVDLRPHVAAVPKASHRVAVVLLEPALHAVLSSIEPFRAANRLSEAPLFTFEFLSVDAEPIATPFGFSIAPTARFEDGTLYDLVLLHSSYEFSGAGKASLFKWLRRQVKGRAQLCASDAAPMILAEAGLLTGYKATSHWSTIASFRELHPQVEVVEQLFVIDRDRATCAGQTACLDYAMAMLERFCGTGMREVVSNEIVYPSLRGQNGPQRTIVNGTAWHTNPILLKAEQLMRASIEEPLTIEELAVRCDISKRELQHLFRKYLKTSPKACYLTFRLQRAKELLLYSDMSVRETGLACGFSSPASYFRAFRDRFSTSPMHYRKAFREVAAAPDGRRLY